MSDHNLQESLQPFSPVLDHIVTKPVGKDLPRQGRDRNARGFSLKYVAEVLEVRISPAYAAVTELEGGDVGATQDLIICVHAAAHTVSAGVLDLYL